jgi:hypothetical protein
VLRGVAVLLLPTVLFLGSPARAQKTDKDKDKDKDKDVTTEKMMKSGVLVGKVVAIYEDKKVIRLQVTIPINKLNPGALQSIQQAQVSLAQARARGDRQGMVNAQRSMAQAQATLYTVENKMQDVELGTVDDVVVRKARVSEEQDEKGKVKKLTKAQLKEMKGPDPKMPGYKAEFGDVATDQIVQVTLVKKKSTGPAPKVVAKKAKPKTKDGDADAAVDLLGEHAPQISMIMILLDPPPGGG